MRWRVSTSALREELLAAALLRERQPLRHSTPARCRGPSPVTFVLHDLPTGAMRHLDRFLGALADEGCRFRQDFPAACVPIRRGERLAPVDLYVARGPAGRRDTGGAPGGEHDR